MNRIICLNQSSIVSDASRVALNVDKSNFFPIVGINAVSTAESYQLSLVVTTASGVRLYYTTADNNSSNVRPHNLTLQHVRLPPGFAASSPAGRPSKVHMSCYQNGTLLLACAQNESTDQLWVLSGDSFPFQVRSLNSTPHVLRKECVRSEKRVHGKACTRKSVSSEKRAFIKACALQRVSSKSVRSKKRELKKA